MYDFIFAGTIVVFAAAAVLDLIRYSVLFEGITRKAEEWARSTHRWKALAGFAYLCNYCFAHWIVGVLLLGSFLLPCSIRGNLSVFDSLLLFFITARLAAMLHENLLRPIMPLLPDESEQPVPQTEDLPEEPETQV